jgi:hypothetical protein
MSRGTGAQSPDREHQQRLPESKAHPALGVMSPADKRQTVSELCSALEQDPRVVKVLAPDINPDFTARRRIYPDFKRTNNEDLLIGSDAFQVLDLSNPIRFHIHVPKKNQPQLNGW